MRPSLASPFVWLIPGLARSFDATLQAALESVEPGSVFNVDREPVVRLADAKPRGALVELWEREEEAALESLARRTT